MPAPVVPPTRACEPWTTPETIKIEGKKTWKDNEDQDGVRPDKIIIRLLANGNEVQNKTVTKDDGWKWKFENLPEYKNGQKIKYTIKEDPVPEYTTEINGFNVTNTHNPSETKVNIVKKWDDANNQDGKRPGFIKVQLYGDEEKVGPEETLNEGNGWAKEWTGLPEKKAGKKIKYTVKEVGSTAGYTTTTEEKTPGSFVIINKHTPETIKIEGKKTWKDNENQDGVRPDQITIRLFADGTEVDSKTVTADDNWQWSFKDLPKFKEGKEIVYTIAEDAVKDYTSKVEKFDVINTHAPGKTGINVTKKWDDKNDKDKIRPGKVTIRLYADGKDTGKSLELSKSNNWTGSFSDLDEKKDGKIIKYTVKEDKVDKYTAAITGNAKKGYVVTNTHNPTNKPLKPPQGENKEPKTGDNTNLVGTLGVLIVSLLVIAGIAYKRKKNNN